ncbi:MAG: hypothetical protein K2Y37_00200 [Pirellulales bacterium]|nr:hypothetical protein [Pirellulales bacterium]
MMQSRYAKRWLIATVGAGAITVALAHVEGSDSRPSPQFTQPPADRAPRTLQATGEAPLPPSTRTRRQQRPQMQLPESDRAVATTRAAIEPPLPKPRKVAPVSKPAAAGAAAQPPVARTANPAPADAVKATETPASPEIALAQPAERAAKTSASPVADAPLPAPNRAAAPARIEVVSEASSSTFAVQRTPQSPATRQRSVSQPAVVEVPAASPASPVARPALPAAPPASLAIVPDAVAPPRTKPAMVTEAPVEPPLPAPLVVRPRAAVAVAAKPEPSIASAAPQPDMVRPAPTAKPNVVAMKPAAPAVSENAPPLVSPRQVATSQPVAQPAQVKPQQVAAPPAIVAVVQVPARREAPASAPIVAPKPVVAKTAPTPVAVTQPSSASAVVSKPEVVSQPAPVAIGSPRPTPTATIESRPPVAIAALPTAPLPTTVAANKPTSVEPPKPATQVAAAPADARTTTRTTTSPSQQSAPPATPVIATAPTPAAPAASAPIAPPARQAAGPPQLAAARRVPVRPNLVLPAPLTQTKPRVQQVSSAEMAAVARLADARIRRGFELGGRGAFYSARSEFTQALGMIAQALDAETATATHVQAMTDGLRAIEESDDFIARSSQPRTDFDPVELAGRHRTPVLKGLEPGSVSGLDALQRYYNYAQERLAVAAGQEPVGAMALHGLGKLHSALAHGPSSQTIAAEPKALVFHQAALLVCPSNFMAANELGVLLVSYGRYEQAKAAFHQSLSVSRQPTTWRNLAVAHQAVGEFDLAKLALQEAEYAAAELKQRGIRGTGLPDPGAVEFVDLATFRRTGEAPGLTPTNPLTTASSTTRKASMETVAPGVRK